MTPADAIDILSKLDNRGYITQEDFAALKDFIAGQAAEISAANRLVGLATILRERLWGNRGIYIGGPGWCITGVTQAIHDFDAEFERQFPTIREAQAMMTLFQITKSKSPLSTKKFLFWHENKIGIAGRHAITEIGYKLMKIARRMMRFGLGRCSWCGRNMGFAMSVSRKGCRCMTQSRCEEFE